jgi:DNA-binding CsgD family transcriptional regulator
LNGGDVSGDLNARDLRRALDVVRELNEAGQDAEVSVGGLAKLGGLVGCDVTSCTRTEHAARRLVDTVTDRPEHNLLHNPEFGDHARQHPGFAAYRAGRLSLGSSVALTDLADMRTLRKLPLYTDFYRPRGTVDQLLCVVQVDNQQGSVLTFSRSRSGFSPRDRALVDLLAPHVAQALAWQERLAAARSTNRHDERVQQTLARWSMLTPRQRQVAEQLSRGATDWEIARSLGISPRTVHKHLEQIYRKLGLTNRAGLMVLLSTSAGP